MFKLAIWVGTGQGVRGFVMGRLGRQKIRGGPSCHRAASSVLSITRRPFRLNLLLIACTNLLFIYLTHQITSSIYKPIN